MAGLTDPFSPGAVSDPLAGVDPETYTRIQQQWNSFLGDPQGRAALLSAGLALMQPPSFGDTATSQIGRAIGAAGQSATANQVMDMKQAEQSSKEDLRASQATAAEARAGTAGERANAANARLELQKEQLRSLNDRNLLGNRVRLSGMYQNYVRDVAKRNENAKLLGTGAPEPVLPMSDWIAANPTLRNLGLVPADQPASGEDIPPVSPPTTSIGPAPVDPAKRSINTVYMTPLRGPRRWTGTGWVDP